MRLNTRSLKKARPNNSGRLFSRLLLFDFRFPESGFRAGGERFEIL